MRASSRFTVAVHVLLRRLIGRPTTTLAEAVRAALAR
jgi:hypothetical protein